MSEESESLLDKLFGGAGRPERQDKVREYISHRLKEGANIREVLKEEYVVRNSTRAERDEIVRDPRVVRQDREGLEQYFESEDLVPKPPTAAEEARSPDEDDLGESFPPPPETIPSRREDPSS